jgi:tetratricopeptide (TPR) repeat protein
MFFRPGILLLTLSVAVALSACRSFSRASSARGEGYTHLESKDYTAAGSAFEKAAALSSDPEEKAKAYLGAGQARLQAGDAQGALKLFYEARRLYHLGAVASQTNRAIGEGYFSLGDCALARRYLSKGLEDLPEGERDLTIAKLIICCRDLGDVAAATQYRSQLKQPIASEVQSILATGPRSAHQHSVCSRDLEADGDVPLLARPPSSVGVTPPGEGEGAAREPAVTLQPPVEGRLLVISRENWNAKPPHRNIEPMGRVDKITVHHTGGDLFTGSTRADAAEEIRRIQKYHQNEQGWADIGYHYVVDRAGNIWQGRRLAYQGAHARGAANYGNVGIVLLGNYCQQGMTQAQRESLGLLVEKLCEHFNIPAQRVYTHREIANGKTDCPGPVLTRCVREIRESLRRRLVAYRPGD